MPIEEEKLIEEAIATLTGIRFEREAVGAALKSSYRYPHSLFIILQFNNVSSKQFMVKYNIIHYPSC